MIRIDFFSKIENDDATLCYAIIVTLRNTFKYVISEINLAVFKTTKSLWNLMKFAENV